MGRQDGAGEERPRRRARRGVSVRGVEARVAVIVADWSERRARGERFEVADVVRAHPDLERELRAALGAVEALHLALPARPAETPPPERIGPYRVLRRIGAGGMGIVYLAEGAGGESVAVKVIHPHLVASPGYVLRFGREAELGMRVRHENVVRTLASGSFGEGDGATRYLVMEHVEGRTLADLARESGPFPERLCRHVGGAVARALGAIHAAGAVHRDVKPDNVIVAKDETVKLMDLGVARVADDGVRLSRTGAFVGSLLYAAPEQVSGGETDARTDLYALGLTLYVLATGVHPHQGDDVLTVLGRQARGVARRVAESNPQISPFFDELVHTLLEKEPSRRFAAADEVARTLEQGEASEWWRVRSRRLRAEDGAPLRRIRLPRETALYGREADLARLRANWERVLAGEGRVVLLEGEAGIGKSRLVDEFVAELQGGTTPVHALFGGHAPNGATSGAGAFVSAFRDQLGESGAETYLADLPQLLPAFQALLRGEPPPPGADVLTRDAVHAVFIQVTHALAAERPTVFFIDDLHFAPEDARAFFLSLALAITDARVLLVGSHRPGIARRFLEGIGKLPHAERTQLGRLGPKDLVAVLRDAFRSDHLAQELCARIAEKSDGNPFFVFEIIRGLKDGQFLRQRDDGTWVTDEIIRSVEVPSSVTDLVQARLAELEPGERDLVEVAACIGFDFDPVLAASVLGLGPIPALQTLGWIERRHGIVRSLGRLYTFDHHQIQEVLHAGLHEQLRERYHAAIGERLEAEARRDGGNVVPGEQALRLARHFIAGARIDAARRYVLSAIEHLSGLHRNQECVDLAGSALAAPGMLEGDQRRAVLLGRSIHLAMLGHRDLERAALDEAVTLPAGDRALEVKIRCIRARTRSETGDSAGGLEELRIARALAEGGTAGERLTVASTRALNALNEGRFQEAEADAALQLECARELGVENHIGRAHLNVGLAAWRRGDVRSAEESARRALEISERCGDRLLEAAASGNLGLIFAQHGDYDGARRSHERHLRVAREIGNRLGEAHATGNLATTETAQGLCGAAIEHYERDLALCRAMQDGPGCIVAQIHLGTLYRDVGLAGRAREAATAAHALARELGRAKDAAQAQVCLASLRDFPGGRDAARETVEEVVAFLRAHGTSVELSFALAALAGHCDDPARAAGHLREAYELGAADDVAPCIVDTTLEIARRAVAPGAEEAVTSAARAIASGEDDGDIVRVAERRFLAREPELDFSTRKYGRLILWKLTRNRGHLEAARDLLAVWRENAPSEARDVVLTVRPHHREIAEAAVAEGIAPPDWADVLGRAGVEAGPAGRTGT